VIVVDANILIYAYSMRSREHSASRRWLEDALGKERLRIPWSIVHTFLRLSTSKTILREPFSIAEAVDLVEEWFGSGGMAVLEPGPRYWRILRRLLIDANVSGALIADAHIAAIAIEHDATLCTADSDFQRFAGLRLLNPLA